MTETEELTSLHINEPTTAESSHNIIRSSTNRIENAQIDYLIFSNCNCLYVCCMMCIFGVRGYFRITPFEMILFSLALFSSHYYL